MGTDSNANLKSVDALLAARGHGATLIRAVRYQVLYTVFRAFELYQPDHQRTSIRPEGIEDVDLLRLRVGSEYVQVKTSAQPWHWSQLRKPIQHFLEDLRAAPRCAVTLAVDFPLRGDMDALRCYRSLNANAKVPIRSKFHKLCDAAGASPAEADALLGKLRIVSLPEADLWNALRQRVAEAYDIVSDLVDTYILIITGKLLEWGKNRTVITKSDLDHLRVQVAEDLARQEHFDAYGRCLITRVSWRPDEGPDDFFAGKATRLGHVAADLDIPREAWLERVDRAIESSGVCVIKSSSGQGKSTLLYRYAKDEWPEAHAYQLKAAAAPEDAQQVREYLEFRARIGLPLLLLIDDAGWRTLHWPEIAQQCAALRFPVLVSVRSEDWHRFAKESLFRYEVVEPFLHLDEARAIFRLLRSRNQVHSGVDSAEWAYERIGEPHLLMEFTYLVTHGQMLAERLRDQVRQFTELNEDPGKVDVLRRVALAHALGTPLRADSLMRQVQLRDDPQQVLGSLCDEYLSAEEGLLTGLHWVRSDHLAEILFGGCPDQAATALRILEAVPGENVSSFVANALCRDGLDSEAFLAGLAENARNRPATFTLAILDGLFEAGERSFLRANAHLFEEAYQALGGAGPLLLASDFLPVVKTTTLTELSQMPGEIGEGPRRLVEMASRASQAPRGLDLCRRFLTAISPHTRVGTPDEDPGATGTLLDWCSLCGVESPIWAEVCRSCFADGKLLELPLDSFCSLANGLYRHDQPAYREWFARNRDEIVGYLKLHLDCIALTVSDDILAMEFFPSDESGETLNEQAMSRLTRLRSAIPFCQRYQSRGIWPLGYVPDVDPTHKDMPRENLPVVADIEKNRAWTKIVEDTFLPDSYYAYQEDWHRLRDTAFRFVRQLSKGVQHILEGKLFDFARAFDGGSLLQELDDRLNHAPHPPRQTPKDLREALRKASDRWSMSLRNFLSQFFEHMRDRSDSNLGRLAVHNFVDAAVRLRDLQAALHQLFELTPDYFEAVQLDDRERRAYGQLGEMLEVWMVDGPPMPLHDVHRYVKTRNERRRQDVVARLRSALAPLTATGVDIIWPNDILLEHPLRYLPLAISIDDDCHPERVVDLALGPLSTVHDAADFFVLIPIHERVRVIEGGYRISSTDLAELAENRSPTFGPLPITELPQGLLDCLPPLACNPSARARLRASILGLLLEMWAILGQMDRIAPLMTSHIEAEVELFRRHEARLQRWLTELEGKAVETRQLLESTCASQQNAPDYAVLLRFLETLGVEGESSEGSVLDRVDPSLVEDALERLLASQ